MFVSVKFGSLFATLRFNNVSEFVLLLFLYLLFPACMYQFFVGRLVMIQMNTVTRILLNNRCQFIE